MKTLLILLILICTSCTVVRYKSTDKRLSVYDFHPGGEALTLNGALTNTGSLDVNRDTAGSEEFVDRVGDAIVPIL